MKNQICQITGLLKNFTMLVRATFKGPADILRRGNGYPQKVVTG